MLNKVLRFGIIKGVTPRYKGAKIYLTNALALIIAFCITLPMGIISLISFSSIAFIPFSALGICLIIVTLNYFGITQISRILLSLTPFLLTLIFGAYLTPSGHPPLASITALCLGFGTAPFILFDIQEKWYMITCGSLVMAVTVFLIPTTNSFFEKDLNVELIESGYIFNIMLLIAAIVAFGGTFFLAFMNFLSNRRTSKLMVEMDHRNDELQKSEEEMKRNIEKIEENHVEEQKRNWASEGLAKFSNLLRSNQDSGVLFDLLISDVTQYIKANQGALFIVDNEQEETVIELKSCYAYNRKKFFEKSIKPGQGLVGQAYFEKDIIYLKDIPQDYLRITSGLGEALPTSALVIPLIVNESVEGFFELAAFQEFEEHEIEFLKNLGENVASFISINRINEKTKYLLEETQQQTEQMKSQEEEMRQNMEELQATQEEMQRKEKEYINRINELERTLEEVTQKI